MASPIQQAQRQAAFLRPFLDRHRAHLLGRAARGLRTLATVVLGTDQRGFLHAPVQVVIAISDTGQIRRLEGWQEPQRPFRVVVTKADLVPDKIGQELARHRQGARLVGIPRGEYGLWSMQAQEAAQVAAFLASRHVEHTSVPPARRNRGTRPDVQRPPPNTPTGDRRTAAARCKHCGATALSAQSGRYGYYWRCGVCGKNTAMPLVCAACGTTGRQDVRVRKDGPQYVRACRACGTDETIWGEA